MPDCCCVSIQGLHPLKDSAFAIFEGESFRETLLTASTSCDVTICSLSFFFFGHAKNLWIFEATKDSSGASSKEREK